MARHTDNEKKIDNELLKVVDETTISVAKENLRIDKIETVTGQVTVTKTVETTTTDVPLSTVNTHFREERIAAGRVIDRMPEIRYEDDRVIIPVVREEEVVTKRLILVEEIHLIKEVDRSEKTERIELRQERVDIQRE